MLTFYSNEQAQMATARYKKLGEYLFVKYLDGNVKKEKDGKFERNEAGTPVQPQYGGYNQEYFDAIVKDGDAEYLRVGEIEK